MGYWDMIGDGVKRITPELSSVMHAAGGKIYRLTSAAFTKIDEMIGVDGSETRAHIALFTTTFAQNAARHAVYQGFKLIPGMELLDIIYSISDRFKGLTVDVSTVKRAGVSAYNYTSATVIKIDQVVRVDGIQKLPQYWPDSETRSQIGLFATTLAKNTGKCAVYEGFKHIPGATVASKLVSDTMREVKREKHKDGLKAMQAKVDRLEEDMRLSKSQTEILSQNVNTSSQNAGEGGVEKAKDMINVFMITKFVGNQMFRDLIVPKIARMEKKNE